MHRKLLVTWGLLLVTGCAAPAARPATEPAPEPQDALYRVSDPNGDGLESIVLEPGPVARISGPSNLSEVRFQVGAVYAYRGTGPDSRHNLGLVIEASTLDGKPSFRTDRRLLLEMDGRVFMSPPPNPRLYSVRPERGGITEVIMVPVDPDLLRRFVDAEVVRARLGRWATLEFSRGERARFAKLLGEIPDDAKFGSRKGETVAVPLLAVGAL